jgi:hypothetical protein
MEKQPIYLQNLELALQMQMAGFNEECVHKAFIDDSAYFDAISILAYGSVLKKQSYKGKDFAGMLNLPTLGEIGLPKKMFIFKTDKGFRPVIMGVKNMPSIWYKTELEARAHAWLWAKQNKKEAQNG